MIQGALGQPDLSASLSKSFPFSEISRKTLPSITPASTLPQPFQSLLPDVHYDAKGLVTASGRDKGHSMFAELLGNSTTNTSQPVDVREVAWHRRKFPQALPAKREEVATVKQWVLAQLHALSGHHVKPLEPTAHSTPKYPPISKGGPAGQPITPTPMSSRVSSSAIPAVPVGRPAPMAPATCAANQEPAVEDIQVVTPYGSDGSLALGMVEAQEKVLSQGFSDLCRQVAVHCTGRGHLLEQLWEQMQTLLQATIADSMQVRSMCAAATESEATKCNSLNGLIASLKDKVLILEQGMEHLNRKLIQKNMDVDQWEKKYSTLEARLQTERHTVVQEATHTIQERLTSVEENNMQLIHQLTESQVQIKQLKTNLLNSQNRLAAAETELEQHREKLGTMTPRPQRNLGILTDLLTPVEANNVQRLLVAGCSPEEVHRLLVGVTANDSDVSRVYHLLGCCKDHVVYKPNGRRKVPMSKDSICTLLRDLISKGDVNRLATYLPENVLDGVSQAVNTGVDPDSLVWLLYGTLSPNGFDVTAFQELGGVLARKYGHTKEEIGGPVTETLRLAQMRTAEKMQQLEEKVKGLGREVQKLKRTIADAKKDKKPVKKGSDAKNKPQVTKLQQFVQTSWGEFFVGLGISDDVPKVLQTTSNVTNWKTPKPDAENQANEIWEGKEEWETENGGKITLQDYMYLHYSVKFKNNQKAITEHAYNLLSALSQHMYDADCNLFVRVFCEEFDEGVREEQDKIGGDIIEMLSAVDKNFNQTVTGWLPKTELKNALSAFFKAKKPERLAEIFEALDTDEGGDVVNYAKLFEEDEDMNQGMFAEVCRTQVLTDRLEHLQEIQDTLYDVCNTLNITTVEPTLLKDILKKVNPYATQEEITEYLQRAFGPELKKAKPVSVADAVLYIRRGFNKLPEPKKLKQKAGLKSTSKGRSLAHANNDVADDLRLRSHREARESVTGLGKETPAPGTTMIPGDSTQELLEGTPEDPGEDLEDDVDDGERSEA